jgi:hypothetical protein
VECEAVVQDLGRIDAGMRSANARIEAERPRNQAIGYFAAALLPPLALVAESNAAEREAITHLYRERDQRLSQAAEMGCPTP